MKKFEKQVSIPVFMIFSILLAILFVHYYPDSSFLFLLVPIIISAIITLLLYLFVDIASIDFKNLFKIIKNILSVTGLIWVLSFIISIKTYDIRLGFENSDITLIIKDSWGLKQERYFVEFNENDNEWKRWSDGKNTKRATLNKNSKQFPLPEKAGIYYGLPLYEREYNDQYEF